MPHWMVVTIAVLFVLGVVGFFALMFAEMRVKRKTGKMRPGASDRGAGKPKPRKSR